MTDIRNLITGEKAYPSMPPEQYRIKFREQTSRCFTPRSLALLAGWAVRELGVSDEEKDSRTYQYDYLIITVLFLAKPSEKTKTLRSPLHLGKFLR